MPSKIPAADWDQLKLECRVVGCVLPGLVTVHVEDRTIECDDWLLSSDPVGNAVLAIVGTELNLRQSFVPSPLSFPNTTFWLTLHNDGTWAIYEQANATLPVRRVPHREAT